MNKTLLILASAFFLTACTSQPPVPDWALNAESSSTRAIQAYLQGQQRVEDLHWNKARAAVNSTAQLETAAKLELMRCAAQVASLQWDDCPAYQDLAMAMSAKEGAELQAYARYLRGEGRAQDVALLPTAQQPLARLLLAATRPDDTQILASIAAIKEPLSRLVAIGVAARTGASCTMLIQPGIDTASEQGWRRPLMAWLLLQQDVAAQAGDKDLVAQVGKRLQLLNDRVTMPVRESRSFSCKATH